MRISDWSSDVCSSDLGDRIHILPAAVQIGNRVDIADALDTVRHLDAALLVLDTRARCTVGLEENSAKEQGLAIAELGRASCRERVWQYVEISVVAVSVKNNKTAQNYSTSTDNN